MEAKKILEKIAPLNSMFGQAAKAYQHDTIKGPEYLREINDHIKSSEETMVNYFGQEIVDEIKAFCKH